MSKAELENIKKVIEIKDMDIKGYCDNLYKFCCRAFGTMAFKLTREALEDNTIKFGDKELQYAGIYFLVGNEDGVEKIYVGQGGNRDTGKGVLARVKNHVSKQAELEEYYFHTWTRAIILVPRENVWEPTDLNMLEHIMESKIPKENKLNSVTPYAGSSGFERFNEEVRQIEIYLAKTNVRTFQGRNEEEEAQLSLTYTSTIDKNTENINPLSDIPEITTPKITVEQMLDLLPDEVWDDQTKFLDPACKGGEFLRAIYDRLMSCGYMKNNYPDKTKRSEYILKNQIYGIALSKASRSLTIDLLSNNNVDISNNIITIDGYVSSLKYMTRFNKINPNECKENIKKLITGNRGYNKDMTFNVVIGNPPYQEYDGSGKNGASALYDTFIQVGSAVGDMTSMIVPMRWMVQYNSKGIDSDWVQSELHNNHYRDIRYTENGKDVFNGVEIKGGVMYFVRDNRYKGKCRIGLINDKSTSKRYLASKTSDLFVKDDLAESILEKIDEKKSEKEKSFDSIIEGTNTFGIESNGKTKGKGLNLYRTHGVVESCSREEIKKGKEYIDLYKVIVVRVFGTGKKGERIPTPKVIEPGDVCTGSMLVIGKSTDKNYCENVAKYMQTKFMSMLVGLRKSTQNATREAYKFVPLQDFTSNSNSGIDWSQPIKDIDQDLYKKYKLTPDEIQYIESTIKDLK
jgi:site-specific DNA-methyltransferase (adenine-specific)